LVTFGSLSKSVSFEEVSSQVLWFHLRKLGLLPLLASLR